MHTNTYIHHISAWALSILGLLIWSSTSAWAQGFTPVQVSAPDTIAGYATSAQTSYGSPNTNITFRFENPVGTVIELDAQTDGTGRAQVDLYGFHTRNTGTYTMSAYYQNYETERPMLTYFEVYPDTIDSVKSSITANPESLAADGNDTSLITVRLLDQYQNPIENHNVTLISSRAGDTITEISSNTPTNQQGEKFFEVSSDQEGISHLTAIDATAGITIEMRQKLIFFAPPTPEPLSQNGGLFRANIFNTPAPSAPASGPVTGFRLSFTGPNDQQNIAVVGDDTNFFRIECIDAQNTIVTTCRESVLLTTTDNSAQIPNDGVLTFDERRQGIIEISLGFRFAEVGSHTIEAFAFNPQNGEVFRNIRGQLNLTVQESADVSIPVPPTQTETIELKTPTEGAEYGESTITITGKGPANANLGVYLDGTQITTLSSDSDGVFFGTADNVAEGVHEMRVQQIEGDRIFSPTVRFSVDTKAPILQEVQLYPQGSLEVGTPLTLTVVSEPDVTASFTLDGRQYVLQEEPSKPGNHTTTIETDDILPGDYPIVLSITDDLGNESTFPGQTSVTFTKARQALPDTPLNVQAMPLEQSVRITWQPVPEIALYVIEGGASELNLSDVASVPANQTSAIIEDLEAGKEYVFQVKAMNTEGKFSMPSDIITAMPLFSEEPVLPAALQVQATPKDGSAQLTWERSPLSPTQYLIEYGIMPGRYAERKIVSASHSSATIPDLINGVTYYFQITAYAQSKPLASTYPETSVTPRFSGTRPVAQPIYNLPNVVTTQPHAGPQEALLFVGMTFLLASAFFGMRRRRW